MRSREGSGGAVTLSEAWTLYRRCVAGDDAEAGGDASADERDDDAERTIFALAEPRAAEG